MLNANTGKPFSLGDPCVDRGVTVAYQAQAHSDALKAVTEFVAATLRPSERLTLGAADGPPGPRKCEHQRGPPQTKTL